MKDIPERLFRELNKFIETHDYSDPEEAAAAFMAYYTSLPEDTHSELDAFDYLERAQLASTDASAVKYAKKALELNPKLTEAELVIAMRQSKSMGQLQSAIEELLQKEAQNLAEQDITEETCAGRYYGIIETRPYIRLCQQYIDLLCEQGKLRKAAEAGKKLLKLNNDDNLGVRYTLMAVYAALEEPAAAEALYQQYIEDSAFMLLPVTALYYKLDETEKAIDYFTRLCKKNTSIRQAIRLVKNQDDDGVEKILTAPYYAPYSKEEFIIAYFDGSFLYTTLGTEFLKWMEQHIPAKAASKTAGKRKKGTSKNS